MRTPSLRRRSMLFGVAVVAGLIVAFDAALYLALRASLHEALDEVLATRLEVTLAFADDLPADQLDNRLTRAGIPAVISMHDGRQFVSQPASPRLGISPPSVPGDDPDHQRTLVAPLPNGQGEVEVFATTLGVDETLDRLLLFEALLSIGGILLAAGLLHRASSTAISPLDQVVATAELTAAGHSGQRLEPDRPATELGRMAVAFDHMLDELEDALADSRAAEERSARFLADAAHQLRTPITGIRASIESLLMESDPVEHDRLLTNVVREASRSSRVIANLLTVARLDMGRPPAVRPTDVVGMCRREVERAQSLAPHLHVDLEAEQDMPDLQLADAEIQEALANLLDNARRHARSSIRVTVEQAGDNVSVAVIDDGPGIPPDQQQHVFERFATLDGKGGSGLGLPIARAVAESHAGRLDYIESRGFVLTLPFDVDDST